MTSADQGFTLHDLFTPLTAKKSLWIIICIGTLVYFNMLFNGFVWDDLTYIIGNQELEGFRLKQLIGQNMFNSSGYFRPVPAIYFSLVYNLFGRSSFYYHLFQLILHLASTSLLLFIYRKFFSPQTALFLSLIFLVHPINVESVSYIGSTQSQLYFLFGGYALYLNFKPQLSNKRIFLIHLFLALALFTKEVSILYIFLVYLYRWISRLSIPRIFPLMTITTLTIYLTIRISVLDTMLHRMEMIPISEITLWHRLLHIPAVFMYYLKTFFFPKVLAINQIWTYTSFGFSNFFLPLIVSLVFLSIVVTYGLRLYRKHQSAGSGYLFFLIWYVVGIAFLLQIFPLDMTVADRWFYFPIVGLLAVLGLIFSDLFASFPKKWNSVWLWVFFALLSILSVRTVIRNADWHDALTLYSRDADKFENYDLQNNLGAELAFTGNFSAALPHFLESVRLLPHDTSLYNAGTAYERLGDHSQAISYYRQAIQIQSNFPRHAQVTELATVGLGRLLLLSDPPEDADEFLSKAVEHYPQNGSLWAFHSISQYALNRYDQALFSAKRALELMPNPTTNRLVDLISNRQKIDLQLE